MSKERIILNDGKIARFRVGVHLMNVNLESY